MPLIANQALEIFSENSFESTYIYTISVLSVFLSIQKFCKLAKHNLICCFSLCFLDRHHKCTPIVYYQSFACLEKNAHP